MALCENPGLKEWFIIDFWTKAWYLIISEIELQLCKNDIKIFNNSGRLLNWWRWSFVGFRYIKETNVRVNTRKKKGISRRDYKQNFFIDVDHIFWYKRLDILKPIPPALYAHEPPHHLSFAHPFTNQNFKSRSTRGVMCFEIS